MIDIAVKATGVKVSGIIKTERLVNIAKI